MLACHAGGLASIPGQCIFQFLLYIREIFNPKFQIDKAKQNKFKIICTLIYLRNKRVEKSSDILEFAVYKLH